MMNIPLMRPDISDDDITALTEVIRSGMLIQGREVLRMEELCSTYMQIEHVVAVSSGTAALHLALMALDVQAGDEVIVPSFSFVATANVVEAMGAKCVFVDIDLATFNIDVEQIETKISPKTKAIIVVHEFGLASQLTQLKALCDRHQLYLIEDAACAMGAYIEGNHVGGTGHIGCFSLHPRKAITTGEGGMLTTNDASLAERLRRLRNHGMEVHHGKMNFLEVGLNYRLTDFQAAMFNSQFQRFEAQLLRKRTIATYYASTITNKLLTLPTVPENCQHSWQTYHVVVDDRLDRDQVITDFKRAGVMTNYGAQCIPAQTYFSKKYDIHPQEEYPNAYRAYVQGLAIPLYNLLTEEEVTHIVNTVNLLK
jgi:perosamine synthetase